jgi:hypothetical protein
MRNCVFCVVQLEIARANERSKLSSHMVKALGYKPEGSRPDEVKFEMYLILLAALSPGVYSASNRIEYRKHDKKTVCGE